MSGQFDHAEASTGSPYPKSSEIHHYFLHDPASFEAPKNEERPKSIDIQSLNLSVIQRHLPYSTTIEFVAPHCVVYVFNPYTGEWFKHGIEGTLFVAGQLGMYVNDRFEPEAYTVAVLNRQSLHNLFLDVGKSEVDLTEGLIVMMDLHDLTYFPRPIPNMKFENQVYGLWIYEDAQGTTAGLRKECEEAILKCKGKLESRKLAPA